MVEGGNSVLDLSVKLPHETWQGLEAGGNTSQVFLVGGFLLGEMSLTNMKTVDENWQWSKMKLKKMEESSCPVLSMRRTVVCLEKLVMVGKRGHIP